MYSLFITNNIILVSTPTTVHVHPIFKSRDFANGHLYTAGQPPYTCTCHAHVSIGALTCGGNANSYFDKQKFGFISKTVNVCVFQLSVGYNMLSSSRSDRIIQKLYLF